MKILVLNIAQSSSALHLRLNDGYPLFDDCRLLHEPIWGKEVKELLILSKLHLHKAHVLLLGDLSALNLVLKDLKIHLLEVISYHILLSERHELIFFLLRCADSIFSKFLDHQLLLVESLFNVACTGHVTHVVRVLDILGKNTIRKCGRSITLRLCSCLRLLLFLLSRSSRLLFLFRRWSRLRLLWHRDRFLSTN